MATKHRIDRLTAVLNRHSTGDSFQDYARARQTAFDLTCMGLADAVLLDAEAVGEIDVRQEMADDAATELQAVEEAREEAELDARIDALGPLTRAQHSP